MAEDSWRRRSWSQPLVTAKPHSRHARVNRIMYRMAFLRFKASPGRGFPAAPAQRHT
jgi:hypothetical protein